MSDPNGQIFNEKVTEKDTSQMEIMKFRKWTLLSHSKLISKKKISVIDKVLLKSPFGHFLKSTDEGLFANTSFIEEACVFSLQHSTLFPVQSWEVLSPFSSSLFLTSKCLDVLSNNELFFHQVNYSGELQKRFKFENLQDAEHFILGELLYALDSHNGQFIVRKFRENGDSYYEFEHNDQFEVSFVQMVKKILPFANLHDQVTLFISTYGKSSQPLVLQGLA